jgi:tetratricopeptide (TPR) repeat protein
MPTSPDQLQKLAESAYARNDLTVAARHCRQLVELKPSDPTARVLAGLVAARARDVSGAIRHLTDALELDSGCVEAHIALSTVLFETGQIAPGLEHAREAVRLQPDDADLLSHLGFKLVKLRAFDEAAGYFERAASLRPRDARSWQNLAMALRDAGREPESVDIWKKVVDLDSRHFAGWMNLGQLHLAHGRFGDAIQCAEKALGLGKDNPNAHLLMALALAEDNRGAEAEKFLLEAVKLDPKNPVAHASLGFWYQEQGRFDQSRSHLERTIALNPQHGFAYYNLLREKRATEGDADLLGRIQEVADNTMLHPRDRSYAHYALGKGFEDLGRFEDSMRHFDAGNDLAFEVWLARKPWDREEYSEGFSRTIEVFEQARFERLTGSDSETPIFIVGMIRSGTSLLEQILSSHPSVAGAGELSFWHENERKGLDDEGLPRPEALPSLAESYLAKLESLAPGADRVTDKLPHNYAMLGLIHAALPRAKIIHLSRDPADNCLSVYTTAYQKPPVFAHRRENIVFAYREYLRIMEHWRSVLPADILLEIDYERLVSDREELGRRVVAFCGLPWDEACLRHEGNRRSVRTPSLWQVRQPVYGTSVNRADRFSKWIPEFMDLRG